MDVLTAKITNIESGMSRNNQEFWRIHLDNGMTLYSYSSTVAEQLVVNGNYTFNCTRKGRFLHIEQAEMIIQQQDPNQQYTTGMPKTEAPFDAEPTTGTPLPQKAIEPTSPPQRTFQPNPNSGTTPTTQGSNPYVDPKEAAMRRGAIAHSSLGNLMSGLASGGYYAESTPEQIVADLIYFAKAIEFWYINGA